MWLTKADEWFMAILLLLLLCQLSLETTEFISYWYSLLRQEPERVSVQLRGRDFTGLGLNVTGNMRDGIFIKDISNRGPAFESGKIAPGTTKNAKMD
jgi:hypothetical protein